MAAFCPPDSAVAKLPAVGAIVSAPLTVRRNRLLILSLQACTIQSKLSSHTPHMALTGDYVWHNTDGKLLLHVLQCQRLMHMRHSQ